MLIAEDEPYLAEAIRDGLRSATTAADIAGDGDSAWELLTVNSCDRAVLDRGIPGPPATRSPGVGYRIDTDGAPQPGRAFADYQREDVAEEGPWRRCPAHDRVCGTGRATSGRGVVSPAGAR